MSNLECATVVNRNFHILDKISSGDYGTVYKALDLEQNILVALKAEKNKTKSLTNEIKIYNSMLRRTICQSKRPIISLIAHGIDPKLDVYYIVLSICGPDLRELKKRTPYDRFTPYTSLWIASKVMEILEFLHVKCNLIHRDIKPSNFVVGVNSSGSREIRVIDFGLSNETVDGKSKNRFMGTLRYSSLNATDGKYVYYSDDLWALYYSFCESINGSLPWRDIINEMKRQIYDKKYYGKFSKHPWFTVAREPSSFLEIRQDLVNESAHLCRYPHYKAILESDLLQLCQDDMKLDWEIKMEQ